MKTKQAFKKAGKAGKGIELLAAGILASGVSGCAELGNLFWQDMGRLAARTAIQEEIRHELNPNQTNIYVNRGGQRARSAKARASGKIHKVWIDCNVYQNEQKGMRIHTKFDIANNQGYPTGVAAYFVTRGKKLMDKDGLYCSSDGQVSVGKTVTPPYQNTTYHDLTLFFPYSQFDISRNGRHNLAFKVWVWDKSGAQARRLSISPLFSFRYTKR